MSYTYTTGDGVIVLDPTTPDGASEPVSNLDDATRQIKSYLRDTSVGPEARLTAIEAEIATFGATAKPCFSAIKTSAQTYAASPSGSVFQITWDSANIDTDSKFASNGYTAPVKGLYYFLVHVVAGLTGGSFAATNYYLGFRINGVVTGGVSVGCSANNGDQQSYQHFLVLLLDTNDVVDVQMTALNGSTAPGEIINDGANRFQGFLIQQLS